MEIEVLEFLIDEDNESKFADHGLTVRQVRQVLENPHLIVRNRRRRRATHLIIGRDHGGACIAIPVEQTHEVTVWRPVTAWPCKSSELMKLEQERI